MTIGQYRAALRALGLTPARPSSGKHTLHQARDGQLYPIRDPDDLDPDQRAAIMVYYRSEFASQSN
jgi:hypothetical protein